MQPKYSAFELKAKNNPSHAAKFDDVSDANYDQRAETHAKSWDRCATLHKGDPNLSAWLVYLEQYCPTKYQRVLDAVAKRGYYTFPDKHPFEFDIRVKAEETPF
jgi:hypothetical protein